MELLELLVLMGFGLLGGIVRTLLGWAKAYNEGYKLQRAWFGLLISTLSGALAAVLIAEDPKIAVIAGLGGADIVEALWKGLAKRAAGGSFATAAGVAPIWITERQMTALRRAKLKGRITIAEYQEFTGVSKRTAQRDIDALVKAGYLLCKGKGRGTYYAPVTSKKK